MPGSNGRWQVHEIEASTARALRELPLIRRARRRQLRRLLPARRPRSCSPPRRRSWACPACTAAARDQPLPAERRRRRSASSPSTRSTTGARRVLHDGRVLYLRWEYTDLPHSFSPAPFHMNPDGTGQTEYYGSNSYWPNSFFYARPIPGHPTKVVGMVTGHHGDAADGRAAHLRPRPGRREADGRRAADPRLRQDGRADHRATPWPTASGRSSSIRIP